MPGGVSTRMGPPHLPTTLLLSTTPSCFKVTMSSLLEQDAKWHFKIEAILFCYMWRHLCSIIKSWFAGSKSWKIMCIFGPQEEAPLALGNEQHDQSIIPLLQEGIPVCMKSYTLGEESATEKPQLVSCCYSPWNVNDPFPQAAVCSPHPWCMKTIHWLTFV